MNIPSKSGSIEVEIHGNFIDGREGPRPDAARCWTSATPQRGDVHRADFRNSTASDIDRAMKSARAPRFEGKAWGGMDMRGRAKLVNRLADAFEANLETLYRLETLNNGRPVKRDPRAAVAATGFLPLFLPG